MTRLKSLNNLRHFSATRLVVSSVGILCGVSGLEHGYFETLQGNVAPGGLLISAIGPANRFWPGGTETALTVVPNFLISGLLAMLASLLVIIWAAAFVERKHGSAVFILLSILQFLVGGGFAQIFLAILVGVAATGLNAPLTWWRTHLPSALRRLLARLQLWLLVAFLLLFSVAIVMAIFGYFPVVSDLLNWGAVDRTAFLYALGYFMLGLLPLAIIAGIAYDAEKSASRDSA